MSIHYLKPRRRHKRWPWRKALPFITTTSIFLWLFIIYALFSFISRGGYPDEINPACIEKELADFISDFRRGND